MAFERTVTFATAILALLILLSPRLYQTWPSDCWKARFKIALVLQSPVEARARTLYCFMNENAGECAADYNAYNIDLTSLEVSTGKELNRSVDINGTQALLAKHQKLHSSNFIKRMQPCVTPALLRRKSTRFQEKNPIALVTAPSGGDPFVRRLLEQLSGIMTGSVYRGDSHMSHREGFLAEGVKNSSVISVSTHAFNSSSVVWKSFDCGHAQKAIIIVRNPFQSIRTNFNKCVRQALKLLKVKNITREHIVCHGDNWERYVPAAALHWEMSIYRWLSCQHTDKLVLHLEDLQSDYAPTYFPEIAEFFGFSLAKERIECVMNHVRQLQRFPADHHVPFEFFTPSHRSLINSKIRRLGLLHGGMLRYVLDQG